MKVILTASGKGGTGKTSLTAAVSAALSERKKKVLAIDGDCCLRNLDLAIGLKEPPIFSFADVINGAIALEDAICQHHAFSNLSILTAPMSVPQFTNLQLQDFCAQAKKLEYEYVFFDGPAGLPQELIQFASVADHVIIVSMSDPAAIRGAESTARRIEVVAPQAICQLVVNRVRPKLVFRGAARNMDDIMDVTGLSLLGIVPEDEKVISSVGMGQHLSFAKRSRAMQAYRNIAARLDGVSIPLNK